MAEEHIVLPKERYQRMLQKLSERKKDSHTNDVTSKPENKTETLTGKNGTQTSSAKAESEEINVESENNKESRTRGDVTGETDESVPRSPGLKTKEDSVSQPPGISVQEFMKIMKSQTKKNKAADLKSKKRNNVSKKRKLDTSAQETKKKKTLKALKKKWLTF